jgi:hypothetical protein
VDLLLKEVPMSRFRTLAHVGLTAAALVLAVSWAASAVPLQTAKPAPEGKVGLGRGRAPASRRSCARSSRSIRPGEGGEGPGLFMIDVVIEGRVIRTPGSSPGADPERLKELAPKKGLGRHGGRRGWPRPRSRRSSSGSTSDPATASRRVRGHGDRELQLA